VAHAEMRQRVDNRVLNRGGRTDGAGLVFGVGTGKSVAWPVAGLSRAIAFASCSERYMLPAGPKAIPCGAAVLVGSGNSVIAPLGMIRPILGGGGQP
jgi:hypothetical protein